MAVSSDETGRKVLADADLHPGRYVPHRAGASDELQAVLDQVKKLSGLLPICASCKKIRDDAGYWHDVADYISEHSEADFSHGICPKCKNKLYPELFGDTESE